MRIRPFQALRPTPETAPRVASVPYDVVDTAEARALADGNPDSFLHVIRPEIDLPEGSDPHAPVVYAQAVDALNQLRARAVMVREREPSLYLYRQVMGEHAQTGLVACCHVQDYDAGLIKRHEKTRQEKEEDRTRHVLTLGANAGPVFLTYRDEPGVDALVAAATAEAPLMDLTSDDGVQHTVWRVSDPAGLVAAIAAVPCAYVADGHHRSAAAARAARERQAANAGHTGEEEYNWFLTVLFPASQLNILPYNRCVVDLNGLTPEAFLEAVRSRFEVTPTTTPAPAEGRRACMYLAGSWYALAWQPAADADPVARLDVSVLQDCLLDPVLGIDDPRTNERISFVGGIRGTAELAARVDSGRDGVAFSMFPVTVEEMMAIADADAIMPPKSTWFEPKLRSGLLVHTLD